MDLARHIARALLIAAVLTMGAPSATALGFSPPSLSVPSATLDTMEGAPLWSYRPDAERRVASTIKMLNALVVRENADLDEVVVVSKQAADIWNGDVGLRVGQKLTVRQLLDMMLVVSANDAAEALAIHVSGTERQHVARMNAKARELGMTRTKAADPHGLSKRETSTARDLAVLGRAFMADPVLRKIVLKRSVSVPRPGKSAVVYRATNQLLGTYTGIEGTKTGFTRPAGFCLVAAAKRGDVEIIGVVLGANTLSGRFSQMRRLLDWGFKHTHARTIATPADTFEVTSATDGNPTAVLAYPATVVRRTLLDGSTVTRRVSPVSMTAASSTPPPGTQVGVLTLAVRSSVVATVALLAVEETASVSVP